MLTKRDITVTLIKRKFRKNAKNNKVQKKLNHLFTEIATGRESGYLFIPSYDLGYWIELKLSHISVD